MASVNRIKTNEHRFRLGEAGKYLDVEYPILEEKYDMVTKLITCVYNPNYVDKDFAWNNVLEDIVKIKRVFLKIPEIIYLLVGIETHDGKRSLSKKKISEIEKNKEKKEKQDEDDFAKRAIEKFISLNVRSPTTTEDSIVLNKYKDAFREEAAQKEFEDKRVDDEKKNSDATDMFYEKHLRLPTTEEDTILLNKYKEELHPSGDSITLDGYPHVHIAIGLTSYNGKILGNCEISKMIMENTNFVDDVQTDSETKKRGPKAKERTQQNIIKYVLKNCKHMDTFNRLGYKDNAIFYNYNGGEDLIQMIKTLKEKKRCIIRIEDLRSLSSDLKPQPLKIRTVKVPTAKRHTNKEEKELSEGFIASFMATNGYAIRKGTKEVYQKVPGSKKSWRYFDTFDNFIYLPAEDKTLRHSIIGNKKYHTETAENKYQTYFPTIDLNFNWIEFNDFYFHIPSAQYWLIDLDESVNVPYFIEDITYDMVREDSINGPKKPDYWLNIIESQSFSKDPYKLRLFFAKFYSILMPLKYKDKVMMLIGAPGTGKSSALDPFRGLFAKEFITQLTGDDKFGCQGLENARLAIADDLPDKTYNSLNIATVFQGDTMITQQRKHVQGEHKFQPKCNYVLAMNDLPTSFKNDKSDRYKQSSHNYNQFSKGFSEDDIFDFANPDLISDQIEKACYGAFHMEELTPLARERFMPFFFDTRMNPNHDSKLNDIKQEIVKKEYALVFLHCASYYVEVYLNKCENEPTDKMPHLPVISKENYDEGMAEINFSERMMNLSQNRTR
tara:strand:+ start:502 stop:2841 length:2340 start_codon:yes stop_codon:yes gene_type:complete